MLGSVSSSTMNVLLLALLLQQMSVPPNFFSEGERIPLRSTDLALNFRGFGRADMIEIVPAGRQDDQSIRVTSAVIRNLTLQNHEKSYAVSQDSRRRNDALTFTPADLRQSSIVILSIPDGLQLQISVDGNDVPVRGPLKESLFL